MRQTFLSAVLTASVFYNCAQAGPLDDIDRLKATPASAFDLGLVALERQINQSMKSGYEVNGQRVTYSVDIVFSTPDNKLTVYFSGDQQFIKNNQWNFEEECKLLFFMARYHLGYDPHEARIFPDKSKLHHVFDRFVTFGLSGDIGSITQMQFWRKYGTGSGECKAPLFSKETNISIR